MSETKKLGTFGGLRMYFMNIGRNREAFQEYVINNYTPTEQQRIRDAFLTIGKVNEVKGGASMLDEEGL